MWRWVGIACLVYGLSSLGVLFRPPSQPRDGGIFPQPLPGTVQAPASIDFEGQFPPPFTRPQSEAVVVERPPDNHLLEWRLPSHGPRLHSLALPLHPPPGAGRIMLEISASSRHGLRIGLREDDGSIYLAPVLADPDLRGVTIGFDELRIGKVTPDENGRLDLGQVNSLVIISPELRPLRDRRSTCHIPG